LAQAIQKPQSLKDSRIDANAHGRISPLNPQQCRSTGKSALSNDSAGQPPPAAGIPNVLAELSK